jgi:hypothetical protein
MPQKGVKALEAASATVLSFAALSSSWAGYQSSLWDGDQAAAYSRASAYRVYATLNRLEGDTRQATTVALFTQWLSAQARGEDDVAEFYRSRFPAEFRPAFNAWMDERPLDNPSAEPTPFSMPQYHPPGRAVAADLERKAAAVFAAGDRASRISAAYGQGATFLATALFFGGIGQVFTERPVKIALILIAALATAGGLARIFALPAQVLGLTPVS